MAIPLWLTVGLLAGLWMPVSGALGVAPWPLFIAWAAYFVAGADMNAMKKVYPSLLLGVVCGYLTIYFGAIQLASLLGTSGVPLFVGLLAALMRQIQYICPNSGSILWFRNLFRNRNEFKSYSNRFTTWSGLGLYLN